MEYPREIRLIVEDREAGSVTLLNRLIAALENELVSPRYPGSSFLQLLELLRRELGHFAAIENFLAALTEHSLPHERDPGRALKFIADYSEYWKDSPARIAGNFLGQIDPEGLSFLTHSHSQTLFSLVEALRHRRITFRLIQTLSTPGEEGRIAHARYGELGLEAQLVDDEEIETALQRTDAVLLGCDALLPGEFLNKTGSRSILEKAGEHKIPCFLITESRKIINRSGWKAQLPTRKLFEWVPLGLVDHVVSE